MKDWKETDKKLWVFLFQRERSFPCRQQRGQALELRSKNGPWVLGAEQDSSDGEVQLKGGSEYLSEAAPTWKMVHIHTGDSYLREG